MPLPNHWAVFNLRSTPFFQDTLRPGDERFPVESLFVGRRREADRVLRVIGSGNSSRQAIPGEPGVGKTSLVQYIKSRTEGDGYIAASDPISLLGDDTADRLMMRILRYVHDAVLLSPTTAAIAKSEPMQQARQLVNAFRSSSRGASLTVLGFGGGVQTGTAYEQGVFLTPAAIVPGILDQLIRTAREAGCDLRGVLLHVNNLENLSEAQAEQAGLVLRDIRDILLIDGYHTLLVGTPESIRATITPHAQLRSVFQQMEPIGAMGFEDLQALLRTRYHYLRLDRNADAREPITAEALEELHEIFGGDLRGLFLACDQAAAELVGYLGRDAATPMTGRDIRTTVGGGYRTEMRSRVGETNAEYLESLVGLREEVLTQRALQEHWRVSQGMVSRVVADLQQYGYLRGVGRAGDRRIRYELTGAARLILDHLAGVSRDGAS